MRSFLAGVLMLALLSSCGYHFQGSSEGPTTISIPYVEGDVNGQLTDQLVRAFSTSGDFKYAYVEGRVTLRVVLVDRHAEPIGWRYEKEESGSIEDELIAVEGRRFLTAEVQLIDSATEEILYGPETITAMMDYDYYEPDVIQDLSFVNSFGIRQSSVQFSLGQLDSSEAAYDDVFSPLAQKLAKKNR
jgi:outer membrane lipopolysaccharide assembly protein LptE/RlpB